MVNDTRDYKTVLNVALKKSADVLGIDLPASTIVNISEDLIDKYRFDSIEDILGALKKGRQGYYGNNYHKLNLIVISDWVSMWLDDKAQAREKELNNKKSNKEPLGEVDYDEYKKRIADQGERVDNGDNEYQNFRAKWLIDRRQRTAPGELQDNKEQPKGN